MTSPLDLVLQSAKPLAARSVVASTLLGVDPPRLPARLLVKAGGLFGIAEGTTRVAISRMVTNGELTASDGSYQLAGTRLMSRQTRQHLSRIGERRTWDGSWGIVVVVAEERDATDRIALRRAAHDLRLSERREGIWLRPDNLSPDHHDLQLDAGRVVDAQCESYTAKPSHDATKLARQLWDLTGWAEWARTLDRAITVLTRQLTAGETSNLAPAFITSAAALRHFQADPLLPDELLPTNWPGAPLREHYEHFDAVFKDSWSAWFRKQR